MRNDLTREERYWAKVSRSDNGCWLWMGACHERGYGRVKWGDRIISATHVAIFLATGEMPALGALVLHHCDNPACVNPEHLYIGSQRENMRDRYERGRAPNQKLISEEQALAWIEMHRRSIERSERRIEKLQAWIDHRRRMLAEMLSGQNDRNANT